MSKSVPFKLGHKTTQIADGELGMIGIFQDVDYEAAGSLKPRLSGSEVKAILCKQTGGSALAPALVAKWAIPGTTVAAVAGSGEAPAGVIDPYLTSSVAQNEYFWLIVEGPCDVTVSASIAANTGIRTAASGKVAATDYTDVELSVGRLIDASSADGNVRRAYVSCRVI